MDRTIGIPRPNLEDASRSTYGLNASWGRRGNLELPDSKTVVLDQMERCTSLPLGRRTQSKMIAWRILSLDGRFAARTEPDPEDSAAGPLRPAGVEVAPNRSAGTAWDRGAAG